MSEPRIDLTNKWVEEFIIGLHICPFAAVSHHQGLIDFQIFESEEDVEFLPLFLEYLVHFIDERNDYSNAFLILPNYINFDGYLELYYKCEELLSMSGSDTLVQLASFHPDYVYKDAPVEEASNFRNRSPYAMIHLLRTEEVEAAIKSFGDTTKVSDENIAKLNGMAKADLDKLVSKFKVTENLT